MAKKPTITTEEQPAGVSTQEGANLPLAKASAGALAISDDDPFGGLPTGLENVTAQDVLIPRLTILQALSPQLIKSKPEFIPEARAGDFCDTGTLDVFKDSLEVLPCYFARVYIEWFPRSSGKGIAKNWGMDASVLEQCTQDEKNRFILPSGNYVAETGTYFVLNMFAGGRRSFIPLASTQLKNSRRWMTNITSERIQRKDGTEFQPPIFYRSWIATPIEQTNPEGSWFGWSFAPGRPILEIDPSKKLLEEAVEFSTQAKDGLVRGDLNSSVEEHAAETGPSDVM